LVAKEADLESSNMFDNPGLHHQLLPRSRNWIWREEYGKVADINTSFRIRSRITCNYSRDTRFLIKYLSRVWVEPVVKVGAVTAKWKKRATKGQRATN